MSRILAFALARMNLQLELFSSWLNGGTIRIYDGERPETTDTAISTQNRLATLAIPDPSGTVTNGVFTGFGVSEVMATTTGMATWARIVDSEDATICDVDVGGNGTDSAIELSSVFLMEGGIFSLTSIQFYGVD